MKHQNLDSASVAQHNIKIVCPHCNKEGNKPIMKRWHFDNCESNPNRLDYNDRAVGRPTWFYTPPRQLQEVLDNIAERVKQWQSLHNKTIDAFTRYDIELSVVKSLLNNTNSR